MIKGGLTSGSAGSSGAKTQLKYSNMSMVGGGWKGLHKITYGAKGWYEPRSA